MKLIYTFTVVIDVESLGFWQDPSVGGGVPITTIQQAADSEKQALEAGELDPVDIICNADNYAVTVQGVD